MQQIDQSDLLRRKFYHIFAAKKFKGMKKVIFIILIIVCFAINASSATYSSIHYFEVSEANSCIKFPTDIWRSPSQNVNVINAIYYSDTKFLNISFNENLGYGNIAIYRNGNEIIFDNPQMNYGNVVSYDLSEYGNGEYVIVIDTGYGDIYVGTFCIISH